MNAKGISPDMQNVEKSTPRNFKEECQFLGIVSYYRRFLRNFSMIAKPMTNLTRKNEVFKWTSECEESFKKLKMILTGPVIIRYLDPNHWQFILDTDACDVGIGAVLSQFQDGCEWVMAYASRTLNKAEKKYCVIDRLFELQSSS